ncbi:c-type cytochrome domain-containing protein [Tamlana sp. 2201CG12-4]|uniref:c-type cytochrome domain-containing protein n=1 Tax=Tamlana sp. 2201CG12-4 TaxID=3112582 RepID=UPI002DBA6EC6|nr:c-type cytochrome domain-containing protein [Tamlana sp. 2201CG12-4]MEC3906547.1 c-type cytochrome domain-containing protein [Tamlana sp. 2201CG12-4]
MKRLESAILNLLLLLHCFLVIVLVFENNMSIPFWLQPLGRMHPLILHFPIVFIVLLVVLSVLKNQIDNNSFQKINQFLVLITAFSTVLATIMGLFLSKEGDATDLLILHKWMGVGISFLMYALVFALRNKKVFKVILYVGFVGVFFAGHYGASLTHGSNFLTEPLKDTEVVELNESTPVFSGFIKPILDAKCIACHNPEKQKGRLDMSSFEKMKLGGKEEGKLWVAGSPEESALLKRVHLSVQDKKHMPPKGKNQLTKSEIELINAWIKQGADEKIALQELPAEEDLTLLVSKRLADTKHNKKIAYNFGFADEKVLKSLEHPFRTVIQKSPKSPAIDVVINGRQTYKPEFLTELSVIKEQIVSLNLSFLPIDKSATEFISTLTNLEELLLNFTDLETDDLFPLKSCSQLKSLALSGTNTDARVSTLLKQMPMLNKVYLWNTSVPNEDIESLKARFSNITFETGFIDPEGELKLTPPLLLSKGTVIAKDDFVEFGHKIPNVEIRYTTDGTIPNKLSKLYKSPIQLQFESSQVIKTITFKDNWLPSKVKQYTFFNKGYVPEKFKLIHSGKNSEFIGDGEFILLDNNKGQGIANTNPYWATFSDKKPLIATADFGENPPILKEIIFSYEIPNRQKQETLASLEIWGGQQTNDWKLLKRITKKPKVLDKNSRERKNKLSLKVSNGQYRYYKIIANPRKKQLLFVDQLFFY